MKKIRRERLKVGKKININGGKIKVGINNKIKRKCVRQRKEHTKKGDKRVRVDRDK